MGLVRLEKAWFVLDMVAFFGHSPQLFGSVSLNSSSKLIELDRIRDYFFGTDELRMWPPSG